MLHDMLWPLLACFVLVGIHAYLGIHVMARKVIFVDLALAQIAALGAVYGVYVGLSFAWHPLLIKCVSVIFTLVGALLFALTRTHGERIPHEGVIGIIYAAALSLTILLTGHLPHGAEEVTQLLSGSILWVTPKEVMASFWLYLLIGVIHFVFRRQFFIMSSDEATIKQSGLNAKLWDFLFYATFGVVVTNSVSMGGVLLVFGFLVIPSLIGILLASTLTKRLIIGWLTGGLVSTIAVVISYQLDINSGPTIVVMLALVLLAIALALEFRRHMARTIGFLIGIVLIIFLLVIFPKLAPKVLSFDGETTHGAKHQQELDLDALQADLDSGDGERVREALGTIKEHHLVALTQNVGRLLDGNDLAIKNAALEVLPTLDREAAVAVIKDHFVHEPDEFIRIEMALAVLALHDKDGLRWLATIVRDGTSLFARNDALIQLEKWLPGVSKEGKILLWLDRHFSELQFSEEKHGYVAQ